MIALVVFVAATHRRSHVWTSERELWASAVTVAPFKPRPLVNWGNALAVDGDLEGAGAAYRHAVVLAARRPGARERREARTLARVNVAVLFAMRGERDRARWLLTDLRRREPWVEYWTHELCLTLQCAN